MKYQSQKFSLSPYNAMVLLLLFAKPLLAEAALKKILDE